MLLFKDALFNFSQKAQKFIYQYIKMLKESYVPFVTWTEWQSGEGRWKFLAWLSQDQDIVSVLLQMVWSYSCSYLCPVNHIYIIFLDFFKKKTHIKDKEWIVFAYLPPPGVELMRPIIMIFIKMNWSKICQSTPSFWYKVPFYFYIFHGLSHHSNNNISHS